jgi:hypothetical protein
MPQRTPSECYIKIIVGHEIHVLRKSGSLDMMDISSIEKRRGAERPVYCSLYHAYGFLRITITTSHQMFLSSTIYQQPPNHSVKDREQLGNFFTALRFLDINSNYFMFTVDTFTFKTLLHKFVQAAIFTLKAGSSSKTVHKFICSNCAGILRDFFAQSVQINTSQEEIEWIVNFTNEWDSPCTDSMSEIRVPYFKSEYIRICVETLFLLQMINDAIMANLPDIASIAETWLRSEFGVSSVEIVHHFDDKCKQVLSHLDM